MEKKTKKIEKIAIIVGVILIPLMYSYFYLQAFWDPYARLEEVPVAVVNLDQGGEVNGKEKNMGEEICDKLKDEKSLGFVFTSEEDAKDGLLNQKYYASITIPEDFTENISTIDGNHEKVHSEITYEANQKKNYLAAQILENAMPAIKESVNQTIDREIVETLCGKLEDVPGKMGELQDGLGTLSEGSEKLQDGAASLDEGAGKLLSGASDLHDGASKAAAGTEKLSKGAEKLDAGLKTLAGAVSNLKGGTKEISSGAKKLTTGAASVDDGAKQLKDGAEELDTYTGGVKAASQGAGTLSEGITAYTGGVTQAADGASKLKSGIETAAKGVNQMAAAVNASISQLPSDDSLDALSAGTANLTGAVKGMQQLMDAYEATGDTKYLKQLSGVLDGISSENLDSIGGGVSGLATGMKSVKTNTKTLSQGIGQLQAGFGDEEKEGTILYGAASLDAGLQTLSSKSAALSKGAGDLSTGLNTLDSSSEKFETGVDALVKGASELSKGAKTLSGGAGRFLGAISKMDQLTEGVSALKNGADSLADGAKELKKGTSQLADGSASLKTGAGTLKKGTSRLHAGSGELTDGIHEAKTGVDDSVEDAKGQLKKLDGLADYAEEPVSTETAYIQPVANYGSAFAPYFMGLSLWVGCLMIFFGIYLDYHRKLKSLSCGSEKHYRMVAVFGSIAAVQGIALAMIIRYALGITVNNMALLVGSCVLTSIVFLLIIDFFIVHTGNIGKFIVLLLLILQLTSSAGTFPIETQSQFFIVINRLLPMTYSTQLFKEAIGGTAGSWAAYNAGILGIFLAAFAVLNIAGIALSKVREKRIQTA